MEWMQSLVVSSILLLGLSACDPSAKPSVAPSAKPNTGTEPIQTRSSTYELHTEGELLRAKIPYAYVNRTGGHVYLVNCNGGFNLRLERWTQTRWRPAWSPVQQQCLSPPIVIDPESTFEHTLTVEAGIHSSNIHPKFDAKNPSGTYRIVWIDALSSFDNRQHPFGPQIPLDARVSNRFRLRLEG